jgi:hypothetical protein
MRDVFYTILVVWIISRIFSAFSSKPKSETASSNYKSKQGETNIKYTPEKKKSVGDDFGDYVDFEEVK